VRRNLNSGVFQENDDSDDSKRNKYLAERKVKPKEKSNPSTHLAAAIARWRRHGSTGNQSEDAGARGRPVVKFLRNPMSEASAFAAALSRVALAVCQSCFVVKVDSLNVTLGCHPLSSRNKCITFLDQ
jgi:hypothetical protein